MSAVLLSYKVLKLKKSKKHVSLLFHEKVGFQNILSFVIYEKHGRPLTISLISISNQTFNLQNLLAFVMCHFVFAVFEMYFRHKSRKDRNVACSLYLFNDAWHILNIWQAWIITWVGTSLNLQGDWRQILSFPFLYYMDNNYATCSYSNFSITLHVKAFTFWNIWF